MLWNYCISVWLFYSWRVGSMPYSIFLSQNSACLTHIVFNQFR